LTISIFIIDKRTDEQTNQMTSGTGSNDEMTVNEERSFSLTLRTPLISRETWQDDKRRRRLRLMTEQEMVF